MSKTGHGKTWTFVWDAYDRLVQVKQAGTTVLTFSYDALGRRAVRSGSIPGGWERLVYDGGRLAFTTNSSNAVQQEFGWEPGSDQLLSLKSNGKTAVALTDPVLRANVLGLADAVTAQLYKQYTIGAWGQATADTGMYVRFRMAGAQYDQEAGLYYMRSRYYDPELGRFLSEDPAGIGGGLNLYAYAGNDPVNAWDPSGEKPVCMSVSGTGADISLLHTDGRFTITICYDDGQKACNATCQRNAGFGGGICFDEETQDCASAGAGGCAIFTNRTTCSDPTWILDPPPDPVPQTELTPHGWHNPACRVAAINAAVTGITDALFFTGVGAGVAAELRAATFAARTEAVMAEYGARGIMAARLWNRAERGAMEVASSRYANASDAVVTGAFKTTGWGVRVGDLSWKDFVPGFASYRAIGGAIEACR